MTGMTLGRRGLLRFAGALSGAVATGASGWVLATPAAAKADVAASETIANLSLNENPWGPSPRAQRAMLENIASNHRYAGAETQALTQKIAELENVSPDTIVLGPGSSPLLRIMGDQFATDLPGGELITATATFEVLFRAFEARGGKVVHVPLDDELRFDLDAMTARLGSSTAGVYVCNPNNPTGTALPSDVLRSFATEAAKAAPVFIDEAYVDMMDDWPRSSCMDLARAGHDVVICRTLSKLHGLAGARIGYAVMRKERADRVRAAARSGGLPRMGVVAALASIDDEAFITESRRRLRAGRLALERVMAEAGLEYAHDSQANYLYVNTGMPNERFVALMHKQNVLVVRRSFQGYDNWNRICVGTDAEIEHCRRALANVLAA
ncbi:MAG: histidinol-phosphate aminotransferase family protein [Gammaproteobacteria bacterium]|nr:MAG: histidinol-phosphate aminotransferase family protein [Gammaproteobacteria bacterium]